MGPLSGYKIVEMAGIGPAPMCAMLLADMGADVLLIDRTTDSDLGIPMPPKYDLFKRGRRSVALDLKRPEGGPDRAAADRAGRRADRGVPARRDGTAGARTRRLPRSAIRGWFTAA